MPVTKNEMLPILARLPVVMDGLDAMKRVALAVDTACRVCDGSYDSVEAVRSASAECANLSRDVCECAYRVCNRLGN